MQIFLDIILPIIIIGAFAAVFAFCLSYLGDRMAVERDERIDDIESKLSGANCGGCGYAGCSQFAEALFKGEATIDKCNSTSVQNKKEIAAILGVSADDSEATVAVVGCCGGERAQDRSGYSGIRDCAAAHLLSGGQKACEYGCMGFGTCERACSFCAVAVCPDKVAATDTAKCTSCGACIAACPKKLIYRIPASAKVYVACSNKGRGKEVMSVCKAGCIGCGKCERSCPQGAIKLVDNLPVIDYQKCTGCHKCADDCPRKCIKKL